MTQVQLVTARMMLCFLHLLPISFIWIDLICEWGGHEKCLPGNSGHYPQGESLAAFCVAGITQVHRERF